MSDQAKLLSTDVHIDVKEGGDSKESHHTTFASLIQLPDQKDPLDWFTWDYCMVFKVGSAEKKIKIRKEKMTQTERFQQICAHTVSKLRKGGLIVTMYKSVQEDEVYVLIGGSERRLRLEADRVDYDLMLNTDECIEQGYKLGIRLASFLKESAKDDKGDKKLVNNTGWKQTYGKYAGLKEDHPDRQKLYTRYNDHPRHADSVFRTVDRLRLIHSIIQADELTGGCGIMVEKMLSNPKTGMAAVFPLHEPETRDKLLKEWVEPKNFFWQPLSSIRHYYGEKIAFYFLWLGFYCYWLIVPSIVGFALFVAQLVEKRVDIDPLPAYGIFVALWATLFLEFWKRAEAQHRVEWGMAHFSEKEQPRPEFVGDSVRSPVDGRLVKVFSWYKQVYRMIVSQAVIWTVIGCVIAGVLGVFFFRKFLLAMGNNDVEKAALIVTSALNGIQIQVFNVFYGWAAVRLNDFENHKTQTEYENALIAKSFIFKFFNSYNTLFYIAFFKQWDDTVGGCAQLKRDQLMPSGLVEEIRVHDCLSELQTQLGAVFGLLIVVNNAVEIIAPMYAQYAAAKENRAVDAQGKEIVKTLPEIEYELAPYESTFDDFDEMAIQYGYVSLFVVAFPLAPLLALINNFIEIRLDASKISKFCRRPHPEGAVNIGTWFNILEFISYVSVITNSLICVFQTTVVDKAVGGKGFEADAFELLKDKDGNFVKVFWFPYLNGDSASKVWAFLIAEHIIIGLKLFLAYAIADEPMSMKEHLARQDYLVDVLINGKEEEPEFEEMKKLNDEAAAFKGFSWKDIPNKADSAVTTFAINHVVVK